MNIRCLVIDDEPLSREVVEKYIADYPGLLLEGSCKDALEGINALEQGTVDLIFLDVNMPKISGVNFYKSLSKKPLAVFITAYPEFAVEGFELDAVDYLLKPFSFERFVKAIDKVKARLGDKKEANRLENYLRVKAGKKIYQLKYEDLLFIEALGDYVKVHTSGQVLITHDTMKHLHGLLPGDQFIRVHKSYIIAKSKLEFLEGNQIKIGKTMIPIGQTYRSQVLQMLKV